MTDNVYRRIEEALISDGTHQKPHNKGNVMVNNVILIGLFTQVVVK